MRIKQKIEDTEDPKTKLTRQYDRLLKLFASKKQELRDLQKGLETSRRHNMEVNEQLARLKVELAVSFNTVPKETQQSFVMSESQVDAFVVSQLDETELQQRVEVEKIRVTLKMARLREQFLANYTRVMREGGGIMDLTVALKGYLDILRGQNLKIVKECEKMQRSTVQDSHIQDQYSDQMKIFNVS